MEGSTDTGLNAGALLDAGQGVLMRVEAFLGSMVRPWNLYQLVILAALVLVAVLAARRLRPPLYEWMRSLEGHPRWRLRALVVLHRRLRMIVFVALIWATVWIMREATWPSRSYILAVVANLSLAWLIVTAATRLIANPIIRTIVRYGAWIWITLRILDLTAEAEALLDSVAVSIGDLRLSLWTVAQAVFVLGLLFFVARFLSATSAERIRRSEDLSPSMQVLVVKLLQILLYGVAFFVGLKAVGVDLTGLAFLSGAIGLGLGFGLQKVVSNLVSGLIILLDKSVKPGDVISLGDTFGWINSLGARYVSVVTRDGKEYLIPNEDLITGQVVNWSHSNEFVRIDLHFGTSYGDDPHLVRKLAVAAALSADRVLKDRAPVCHITGFGDSSVDYILRFWISDPTGGLTNIRGNVFLALWDTFREHGVTIPFPQREVRVLSGSRLETVAQRPQPAGAERDAG